MNVTLVVCHHYFCDLCHTAPFFSSFLRIEVTFEKADGTSYTVQGKEGDNLLDVAVNNDLDLDGFGKYFTIQILCL